MSKGLAGKSVLLIDQDEQARLSVRTELAAQGAGVIEARDCQGAIEVARSMAIDAVVAELRLPGGNALELFASLSLACQEVPLFFLLADENDIAEHEAKAMGVATIFSRTLNPGLLVADIASRVGTITP